MNIPLVTDIFAWLMRLITDYITVNFGMAIILFGVITKLMIVPLQLKSKKGMLDQQRIQPQLVALEKKYRNNKQKYSEEVQKLYKKENVSLMGGCLPSLLMIVLLFGLYGVIYKPVTYLMVDKTVVKPMAKSVIQLYDEGKYTETAANGGKATIEALRSELESNVLNELTLAHAIVDNVDAIEALDEDYKGIFAIDFDFLGMDLGAKPSYQKIDVLTLLPIISALTAFATSWLSQKINNPAQMQAQTQKKKNEAPSAADQMASTSKMMLYTMPLISLFIGFQFYAGISLYWILNNVLSAIQEPLLTIYAKKKYGVAIPAAAGKAAPAPVEVEGHVKEEEPSREEEADGDDGVKE